VLTVSAAVAFGALAGGSTSRAVADEAPLPEGVVAVVNGEDITQAEFDAFFVQYVRSKFYHGVPKDRWDTLRAEVADEMVLRRLLMQDAEKRGLTGDQERVEARIKDYEKQYQGTEARSRLQESLPQLRTALLRSTKVDELMREVRHVAEPSEAELRAYYTDNIELFTEPKRDRLSLILFGVDPSETSETWEQARLNADDVFQQLEAGASFADLARQHSTHESAERDGDLGYVHGGMLSLPAQEAVDKLALGEVSPPVQLLEGHALFRLDGRQPPQLRDFDEVRDRALALYARGHSDAKWESFIGDLKNAATVRIIPSMQTEKKP
jgi:parvulin-like peptidyl-prolyl isomerase